MAYALVVRSRLLPRTRIPHSFSFSLFLASSQLPIFPRRTERKPEKAEKREIIEDRKQEKEGVETFYHREDEEMGERNSDNQ